MVTALILIVGGASGEISDGDKRLCRLQIALHDLLKDNRELDAIGISGGFLFF